MVAVAEGVVLQIMRQRGVDHDVVTKNALMDGYCMRREMDEARKFFDSMIDLIPRVGKWTVGNCKFFNDMQAAGLAPDRNNDGILLDDPTIEALCKAGKL
ncbi:hypothetical protein RJ640_010496 [Escallonia rubra]|uniref:Pentatricopeptide repeat-containing protein n=1 Tax=Escallonia rubra TaxID=112253 RepID=A0AA88RAJ2_9ASTE|nr:hypothetical protein RJ640_010496 [Escallonia rubra]